MYIIIIIIIIYVRSMQYCNAIAIGYRYVLVMKETNG